MSIKPSDQGVPPPPSAPEVPPPPPPPGPAPGGPPVRTERSGWKIASIIVGSFLALFSLGLLAAGGVAMWADQAQRDAQGFLSVSHDYRTSAYALTVEDIDLRSTGAPSWAMPSSLLGTVRIRVTPTLQSGRLFVGIARTVAARHYLRGVRHAEITDFGDPTVGASAKGGAPSVPPTHLKIWSLSASGAGTQTLLWHVRDGSWSVVMMNADGSAGVDLTASAGATVPSLIWIASGLLIAGGIFAALAILLIVLGVRQPKHVKERSAVPSPA